MELWGGGNAALVLLLWGDRRVGVDLAHVKAVVAGITDAAADLVELLASSGQHHA